jgi:hypothetical protein
MFQVLFYICLLKVPNLEQIVAASELIFGLTSRLIGIDQLPFSAARLPPDPGVFCNFYLVKIA